MCVSSTLSGSIWENLIGPAVREFNQLSSRHRLGVTLKLVHGSVANIILNVADGSASFSIGDREHTISLPGNSLQGRATYASHSDKVFQSYVFLPSGPQINTPDGPRPVGDGVKLTIAVHEFIHCCGLSNSEHSSDDIFTGNPTVDYGATPEEDVVIIRAAGQPQRAAPPLFLGRTTISRVRGLWVSQGRTEAREATTGSTGQRKVRNAKSPPGPMGIN